MLDRVGEHFIAIGNACILDEQGIDTRSLQGSAEELQADGAKAIFVGVDGRAVAVIGIADTIKASTPDALDALEDAGMHIIMLAGENWATAAAIARRLGMAEVEADVLPDQNGAVVSKLRSEGRVVAMTGDGVNDAPADVGIAMVS